MAPLIPRFQREFRFDMPVGAAAGVVERLRGTPARLEERLRGCSSALVTRRIGDRWSIQENVVHLWDLEPLWLGRVDDVVAGRAELRAADLENRQTHSANSSTLADSSRREATFAHMTGGAYLIVSPGAVHNSFGDFGVIVPQRFPLARQDFRRTIEITNAYLLAFFDTHVRGRSSALLKGKSPTYPEVTLTVYRPGTAKRVFRGAPTWERPDRSR